MITVSVELYAVARELAGTSRMKVAIPDGGTTSDLLETMSRECPALGPWAKHLRIAVNREYVEAPRALNERDEIALIPPVSGG